VTPWGIKRVNGPIKPNPKPNGKIFVIDTGIAQVSDLNVDTSLSVDFSGAGSWNDGNGHGTHVAGTIAAIDNSINVVGVVPGASVVAVRVLDSSGVGSYSNVIAGVNYVASKGKAGDVANMSLGGGISSILNDAVSNAAKKGILFAVAAGNSKDNAENYSPASASGANVYTVSCYDSADTFCSFSNFGSLVRYSGPGLSVLSLSPDGGTSTLTGTSMSCPHIAGLLFAGNVNGGGFVKGDPDGLPDTIAVYAGATAGNPPFSPAIKPTPVVPPMASPGKPKRPTAKPKKKGKLV
jgi:subtilisin family serine protease